MTVEEFAQQNPGKELTIYFKNGEQKGVVCTGGKDNREVISTDQTIQFELPSAPENGISTFFLDQYREGNGQ